MNDIELECFKIGDIKFPLVPASPFRDWMDAFPNPHPYRCLPLSIANAHAWHILCPFKLEIMWNGGPEIKDLEVKSDAIAPDLLSHVVRSNFSRGIATFHVGYMFRTPPEWNLMISGPYNEPKDGIYPLTGIIETGWLPYPFTMNWQLTRPGIITFEKDEPICSIMPIPKSYIENVTPKIYAQTDDPILDYEHNAFREERERFSKKLSEKDPETKKRAWQKHYFTGQMPDGTQAIDNHQTKLRLKNPIICEGQKPVLARNEARVDATKIKERVKDIETMKWSETSILNDIPQDQTDFNTQGRRNVSEGALIKPAGLHIEDADPGIIEALDFSVNDGFLTKEQCALMIKTFDECREAVDAKDINNNFWQGRLLFMKDIQQTHPETFDMIVEAIHKETAHIQKFYELKQPIFCDLINIVFWPEGKFMPPHADNANPDGSHHNMPYRDFSSICYLNDDYEGGNVYFTALDMSIRPKIGRNLSFTGGFYHEHSVLKVTKGSRYSLAAFYTFDEKYKDALIYSK